VGATTTKKAPAPVSPYTWIVGLLTGIHAPVTKNNVGNVGTWLANEQTTTANWSQNQGNPLGVQTPAAIAAGHSGNVRVGLSETVHTLLSGYPTIVKALRHNAPATMFNQAVAGSSWNGSSHYGGAGTFAAAGKAQKGNPTGWWGQWIEPILENPIPLPGLTKLPGGSTTPGGGVITNAAQKVPGFQAASSAASGVTSVGGFLGKITSPTNLKNTGIFLAGAALTVTGLLILFASTKGKQTLELAGEVA
jgi:hypothetical protein